MLMIEKLKTYFDHDRLDVYQEAIAFCGRGWRPRSWG